jgi:hypothetical protein
MKPILTVEFSAKAGDETYREESIPLHSPEELFAFVAPGGGCDNVPNDVAEIKMVFLPPEHGNKNNPMADRSATLQIGMVFFSGPLSEISQTAEQLIDRAGRGELSASFLKALGAAT